MQRISKVRCLFWNCMRLAIIGTRDCKPIEIDSYVDVLPSEIVSGGAKGVDTYARIFAERHNLPLTEFRPEYDKYGKSSPIIRNKQIVEYCDSVLAFWDGKSKGTQNAICYAKKLGKPIKIIKI